MSIEEAKKALDSLIRKARVHFYKPIQIAEILYHYRIESNIELNQVETYRNISKKWRDEISQKFLGRTCTSSARYQDDLFNQNAIPPQVLVILGEENKNKKGMVEAYIYQKFSERCNQMTTGLKYCNDHDYQKFNLNDFLSLFWHEPGLKRSIDKIYEIVVYALFSALVDVLDITVEVTINNQKLEILKEFEEFAQKVINLNVNIPRFKAPAKIYRVGITNAADRGLDMWANFGLAIQIKHLSLDEELAESIVNSVSADRILIVCKESEEKIILSLLNQLGWKSRIQSIITEKTLLEWYEKALRGQFSEQIGSRVIEIIQDEIQIEFPSTEKTEFDKFLVSRGYQKISTDPLWN